MATFFHIRTKGGPVYESLTYNYFTFTYYYLLDYTVNVKQCTYSNIENVFTRILFVDRDNLLII